MVDDEYNEALHTKSYTEMCSRVLDHQLKRSSSSSMSAATTNIEQLEEEIKSKKLQRTHSSHALCGSPYDDQIPDFLLEPSQESLLAAASHTSTTSIRSLLLDFFNTTFPASTVCLTLLSSIVRARAHHRNIHHLLLNLSSSPSAFSQLSSHLNLDNPLSPQNLSRFHLAHSRYPTLIRRLTSAHKKISQRRKRLKFTKKASGVAVIALLGAAVTVTVVIASHGAAAVAAVASPMMTAAGGVENWFGGWMRLEREKARVNAAAKGAYIVGRDLDTMSQMLRRVHDEVEHCLDMGRMVVRNREWEMVKEVVKEMEGRRGELGLGLEEQLEEFEEHVYLCLITINRSRRLVAQEMVDMREGSSQR